VYWQHAHDRLVGITKRETTTAREIYQIRCMVALFLIFPADTETFGHAPRPLRNKDTQITCPDDWSSVTKKERRDNDGGLLLEGSLFRMPAARTEVLRTKYGPGQFTFHIFLCPSDLRSGK